MSIKDLSTRWRTSAENDLANERIFNICKYGGVLSVDQSPFGRQKDDLIDFRGYSAQRILVKEVQLKDIDLSYADFSSSRMENNFFENCRFERSDFTSATEHGNRFSNCIFLKCKFKQSILGYRGSNYQNCVFKECDFQKADFIRAEFVDTTFLNSWLKRIDFNASSFENCGFEGLLDNVWFRGTFAYESDFSEFGQPKPNRMLNVSFENADLRHLTFSNGCDLSTVKIKNNGRYLKYDDWYGRLQFLRKEIESWDNEHQKSEAAKFLTVSLVHAPTQNWEILNLDDWEEFYRGKEVPAKIIETLNRYPNS